MKAAPQMVSPRIARWAVTLRAHEYAILYKVGKYHGSADALSRLPLPETPGDVPQDRVLMLGDSDTALVTAEQALARSHLRWPKLGEEIETHAAEHAAHVRNTGRAQQLRPYAHGSGQTNRGRRSYIDYAGPFMGNMFSVVIDAHSKWMDVYPGSSATSTVTIDCLCISFEMVV
ncbi:hypothetical protein AAFF_G00242970 [Aldrovandia affinis]|uniref:Uncharacterized protein n=1 Tax=Aldrovandia affinis TaxID=143900 RepID=A0AAD7W332_9TELE|nr:hypothetical protein AAFF_G00242970 [Aldrovandia affinis]